MKHPEPEATKTLVPNVISPSSTVTNFFHPRTERPDLGRPLSLVSHWLVYGVTLLCFFILRVCHPLAKSNDSQCPTLRTGASLPHMRESGIAPTTPPKKKGRWDCFVLVRLSVLCRITGGSTTLVTSPI